MELDYELKWDFLEYQREGRSQFAKNRQLRQFLNGILNLQGDERILDVGCGIGTLGKLLGSFLDVEMGGEMIGIDLDPILVTYGNQHWGRRPSIHLEVGDANYIEYPDQSFNMVISLGLLEHVSNTDRILSEMIRVLKRPGKLIVAKIDLQNFSLQPKDEKFERFYFDIQRGMKNIGIDLEFAKFHAYCERNLLPLEEFIFTIEYRSQISKKYIRLVEEGMKSYFQKESMIREVYEFNYQFLKHVGWTKAKVKEFINYQYSIPAHLEFLKAHFGETFCRKMPIRIYRIQFID